MDVGTCVISGTPGDEFTGRDGAWATAINALVIQNYSQFSRKVTKPQNVDLHIKYAKKNPPGGKRVNITPAPPSSPFLKPESHVTFVRVGNKKWLLWKRQHQVPATLRHMRFISIMNP